MTAHAIQRNMFSAEAGILLTGATGFLGGAVMDASTAADWQPLGVDEIPAGSKIIHLGTDLSNTTESIAANAQLDAQIAEVALATSSTVVYASTNNVYAAGLEWAIDDRLHPVGPYAISKVNGEVILGSQLGASVHICRLPDVFGPGQRHGNFFRAIESAIRERGVLRQFGAGQKRRTYIHVIDAARALLWIAQLPRDITVNAARTWNLGYRDSATLVGILEQVSDESGLAIEHVEVTDDSSWHDIRTMQVTEFPVGVLKYQTFTDAMSAYIHDLTPTPQHRGT